MAAVLKGTTLTLMIKPVLYSKITKGIVVVNHCIEVKFSKLPIFFSWLHFLILAQLAQSSSSISAHRTNELYFEVIIPSEEKTVFAFKSTQKRCSSKCHVTGADHEVILILTVVLKLRSIMGLGDHLCHSYILKVNIHDALVVRWVDAILQFHLFTCSAENSGSTK